MRKKVLQVGAIAAVAGAFTLVPVSFPSVPHLPSLAPVPFLRSTVASS